MNGKPLWASTPTDRSVKGSIMARLFMPVQRSTSPSRAPDPRRCYTYRTIAQIFRDRGFDATSVSDIARALGLTKAGPYHHFESKEALLFEIMMFGLDKVRDEVILPVRAIRDPEERLRQLILRHARITTRGHGAVAHLQDEIRALRRRGASKSTLDAGVFRSGAQHARRAPRHATAASGDRTVATFSVIGMIVWLPPVVQTGRPAHPGTGRGAHREHGAGRAHRPALGSAIEAGPPLEPADVDVGVRTSAAAAAPPAPAALRDPDR
jgi:TetR/AcrR family transcriptional regulator, cholesterol catabolism regulator